jgi:hypothetical protein
VVASSLPTRNVEVEIVAPEKIPMEKILGSEAGNFIRKLHEQHGVKFHLGTTASSIDERTVTLTNGEFLQADMVVVGIGVRPAISLAQASGIAIDRGVIGNEYLETSGRLILSRAISHARPIRSVVNESGSSIMSSLDGRDRSLRIISSAAWKYSTLHRSFGPCSTTLASATSGMPKNGTPPKSREVSKRGITPLGIGAPVENWQSQL